MIPRRDFDRYCRQVDNLAEDARLAVAGVLEGGIADPGDVAAARDLAISALTDVLGTYAVASAAAAADFYERSGGSPAVLGDADLRAIEGTVRYQAGKLVDGDVEGFVDQVSEFAAHAVKLSANRQMIKNAEDGSRRRRRKSGKGPKVRFARVPTGPETCTFCTMLASRGSSTGRARTRASSGTSIGNVTARWWRPRTQRASRVTTPRGTRGCTRSSKK